MKRKRSKMILFRLPFKKAIINVMSFAKTDSNLKSNDRTKLSFFQIFDTHGIYKDGVFLLFLPYTSRSLSPL